jgi:hypothetical protein
MEAEMVEEMMEEMMEEDVMKTETMREEVMQAGTMTEESTDLFPPSVKTIWLPPQDLSCIPVPRADCLQEPSMSVRHLCMTP